jgi:molybdopterin synthase catalytic subunit
MAQIFSIQPHPLDIAAVRDSIASPECGGFVFFEGRVRNHHAGRAVAHLHYEAYRDLAEKEGQRIVVEICEKHGVRAAAVHAVGELQPGDLAVWAGAAAAHREAAFVACRELIDAIKARVPVWKREFYTDGRGEWIEGCDCVSHHHGTQHH